MAKNAFGLEMCQINEILKDKKIEESVTSMLLPVLLHLGLKGESAKQIIANCLSLAKTYSNLENYEKETHEILKKEGVTKGLPDKLTDRAKRIYLQVKPYLLDGSVLDFGCGDGKVGELLAKDGFNVELTDVYENPHIKNTGLNFTVFKQGEKIPFKDGQFDNTLVLTVYHHADDPIHAIKESHRVTKKGGKVIVIESVYGIDGKELPSEEAQKIQHYISLSGEQQRKVNIFFDHFYNRIIHYSPNTKTKVLVPFNFNEPDKWKEIFSQHGLMQEKIIHLGIDQPAVPEYHTLHVLRAIE